MNMFFTFLFSYISILIVYKLILAKEFFTRRDFIYGVFFCAFMALFYYNNFFNSTTEFLSGISIILILIITHREYGLLNASISGFATLFVNLLSNNIIEFSLAIMNVPVQVYTDNSLNYFVVSAIIFSLASIFALITYKIKTYIKKISADLENKNFMYCSAGLFGFIAVSFYYLAYHNRFAFTQNLQLFSIVQLISIVIIFAFLLVMLRDSLMKQKLRAQEKIIKEQSIYIAEIERIQKNLRVFKHDYKNVTLGALKYIDDGDIDNLKCYYQDVILKFENTYEQNDTRLDKLKNFKQKEIQSIIWSKLVQAIGKKINFRLDIERDINYDMLIIDICRIIGIWLDNAIEASSPNDTISLLAYKDNNYNYFVIENNCYGNVDLMGISNFSFSTKGKNRGVGLKNVSEIINDNDNIENHTEIEGNKFRQILVVENRG